MARMESQEIAGYNLRLQPEWICWLQANGSTVCNAWNLHCEESLQEVILTGKTMEKRLSKCH